MYRLAVHSVVGALLLGAAAATAAPAPANDPAREIPNQYIVEYAKGAPVARQLGGDATFKVLKTFDSPLFSGAAVEVADGSDAFGILSAAPHIVNIWPNRRIPLDQPVSQSRPQSVANAEDDDDVLVYSTHRATGVDRLHAQGVLGQGVKVAIIDTGVWYRHPALGGGFGPGFKVAGGWDLVGDADPFDSFEPKKPDADPISLPDFGHGTHVAGIVAAKSDKLVGVAPNATLYAYKITGRLSEQTDDATLIDAFLRAEADGVDVINASYGSTAGWSDAAWAVVVQRVVDAGVIVTVTAGNEGASGPFIGVSAGSAPGGLTVASVQAETAPATPFRVVFSSPDGSSTHNKTYGYVGSDILPHSIVGWPLVDMGSTDPSNVADACEAYPAGSRNLTGTIPLVRRGGCTWRVKQANLYALGARVVLAYNDDRPIVAPGNTLPDGDIGCTTAEAGAAILKAIRQDNATVTIDFSIGDDSTVGVPDGTGNTPNSFSGWPATYDMQLKPDIAAPGGNILSTWSGGDDNEYMLQSGTSMAAPYIAGIAALYVGMYGGRNGPRGSQVPRDFHRRIAASGATLPWTTSTGEISSTFSAPPTQMGAGLVDAWRTMYADSGIDVTRFNLNDTKHFRGEHEVTITNSGKESITYNFTLEPAAGFEILDPDHRIWHTWAIKIFTDLVPIELVPEVVLPAPVTLAAGESRKVSVVFANPEAKNWNATVMPLYSGKVKIAGSNGDRLSVGYMGLASDLYAVKHVFQKQYPIILSQKTYQNISFNATYNFNSSSPDFNFPAFYQSLDWGTHEMRWDIFESNWDESRWTYPPTAASGLVGAVRQWQRDWDQVVDPADPEVVRSRAIDTPIMYLARAGFALRAETRRPWLGHLVPDTGSGSRVGSVGAERLAPGNYTMRIAAARPFADLSKVEGWEVERHEIMIVE
ncbi:peptidase S8/S53 domain-containing protein [Microdochium bolleyi]|uniref:Peptidase S8/S53 domain-containing protein n=1 Tax=Microdochium bolleyi TaxID=196109 RepID=A0A136JGD0_9PEZI|nr:peptidase S8/S53 domain-containing protein [Microdochium bolleyi]